MAKCAYQIRNSLLFAGLLGILTAALGISLAQSPEPQREQLLNGLRVLLVPRPGDSNVLIKLRVHSGAAFDIAGKAGTMSLLGELMFPDQVTYDYFKEEVNGQLLVQTDLDSINVTMQGRASEFDRMIDTLRVAVVNTPLSPENVTRIRDARAKALREKNPTPADVADRIIAERLFGSFPYGRPVAGTAATLQNIDRADLMLARDRFLSPNNATLAVIGGVDQRHAMRTLRQLLGGWRKSEELVPATFRMPDQPDARVLVANYPSAQTAQIRIATRGLARGDRDCAAANLLANIARERWQKLLPESASTFVRHEAYTLPGIFVMGTEVDNATATKALEAAKTVLKSLVDSPVSPAEIESARNIQLRNNAASPNENLAKNWLDVEAYSLETPSEQLRALNALTASDLQRVAIRLFREASFAIAIVGNADSLKTHISQAGAQIEGEQSTTAGAPQNNQSTGTPDQPKKRRTFVFIDPKGSHPVLKTPTPTPKPD